MKYELEEAILLFEWEKTQVISLIKEMDDT